MSDEGALYEFGPFSLDARERVLLRDGERVTLTPKVFDTLLALVRSSGKLLEKDVLMEVVWPGTVAVEEGNLANNVFLLRKALGETAGHKYIETVSKRGYRFVAEVKQGGDVGAGLAEDRPGATKAIGSLAVLPFIALNEDSETALLGVGMADSLITRLSNIRQVRVRPTSAVQRYMDREQNPLAAGSEQRVDAVLEGSIQRSAERIRVNVRLLRVGDGRLLWSGAFADNFTGLFTIEDSILQGVAGAVTDSVSPDEQKRVAKRHTTNPEAFQAYARGRYYSSRPSRETLERAVACFQEAIHKDPGYALAWAALAYVYDGMAGMGYEPPCRSASKEEHAANQALALDDGLGWPHASLAFLAFRVYYDRARAEREFNRALELSPNEAPIHFLYAFYLALADRTREAQAHMSLAVELDPLCLHYQVDCALPLYCARQYGAAIQVARKALEAGPEFLVGHLNLGILYLANRQLPEALSEFQKALPPEGDPEASAAIAHVEALQGNWTAAYGILHRLLQEARERYVSPASIALIYAALGEKDQAFQWLEQAFEDRSWWLMLLKVDHRFESLRSDRRFEALLQRVGFTP